jgi:transcriptional regulator with XRE-family HTH domain
MNNALSKSQGPIVPVPRFYMIDSRNKLRMSAEQVSRKLGLGKVYYYQIENGQRGNRMGAPLIFRLIKVLEMDATKFLECEIEHERMCKRINGRNKKNAK